MGRNSEEDLKDWHLVPKLQAFLSWAKTMSWATWRGPHVGLGCMAEVAHKCSRFLPPAVESLDRGRRQPTLQISTMTALLVCRLQTTVALALSLWLHPFRLTFDSLNSAFILHLLCVWLCPLIPNKAPHSMCPKWRDLEGKEDWPGIGWGERSLSEMWQW